MIQYFTQHPIMRVLRTDAARDWAALLIRVAVGAVFIAHGYPKLFGSNTEMFVKFFGSIGVPAPAFFAPFVGVVEFFGGICLLLGLVTRFWAAGLVIDMAVAILSAKGLANWGKYDLELILLVASLSLFLTGAGRMSVDAKIMKK